MILAAGRGERMRPLTDTCPKPLLTVGGKPLIVWHIENLVRAGIKDIVINHAHLGAQLEAALGDGAAFGAHIQWSPEPPGALETAGGIANALGLLGDAPFAVINGDIWCDYPADRLVDRARTLPENDLAHLVLVPNPPHNPNGDFCLEGRRVVEQAPLKLTFAGIGLYRPALFAELVRGEPAKLAPLLRSAIAAGLVSGEAHDGEWVDVGTPQRLAELDAAVRRRSH